MPADTAAQQFHTHSTWTWVVVLTTAARAALNPRAEGGRCSPGIPLEQQASLPLAIAGLPDFERGVVALAQELVQLARQSPEGRQALLDLGFEPVLAST